MPIPRTAPGAAYPMVVKGKRRRYGRSLVKRPDWKKAIVTLKPGDSIELFEGV